MAEMGDILRTWRSNGLTCKAWLERDGVFRGCVFVGHEPVRASEISQRSRSEEDTVEELVEAVDALAAMEARPRDFFDLTDTPFVDIALKLEPPSGVPEEDWIKTRLRLADDLYVLPRDWEVMRIVVRACDPPGIDRGLAIDLRSPLYAIARTNPPRESVYAWDPDLRIRTVLALSRLIRPSSFGSEYSGRIIGDLTGRHKFIPGAVRGEGTRAWTSEPEHDWLTAGDFTQLSGLILKWDTSPLARRSRLAQAFWYFAYAAQTEFIDIRWSFIATGLETILSSGAEQATRDFTHRVAAVAQRLGIEGVGPKEASKMWGLRSRLVHGAKHGGLTATDFSLYHSMERVLREVLLTAIRDEKFRDLFSSVESVQSAFPVPPRPKHEITCPHCRSRFEA